MRNTEKFWDMLSNQFDKPAGQSDPLQSKMIENAKKHLKGSDIVLDYGCATGRITYEFAGSVKEIRGIDISSKMIQAAKRKAGERKSENIDFAQSTIFDERLGAASFDVILAFNILHFFQDTQKVMQRINELLKPGGLLISATPCLGENKTFLNIPIFLLTKTGLAPFIRFYKISELKDSMTEAGFQIVETASSTHIQATHLFVAAKKI